MSRLARGISITAASQASALAIQLAGDVVLARLLGPGEFGKYLAVFVFVGFAMQFRDIGLSAATIQSRTMTEQQGSNLHWLNLGIGAALTAAFALCSPLIGLYYGTEGHMHQALALSLCFVLAGGGAQYQARLTRDHGFGALAAANLSSILLYYLVAVLMAVAGFGVWSLVVGLLLRHLSRTVVLRALCPWRPLPFSKGAGIRGHLRFGGHVAAFDVVNYASRNIDNFLVGSAYGSQMLGLYNRAYQIMLFPITQLRGPLVAAGLPSLADHQKDGAIHASQFLWIVRALATCAMPIGAFTGIYAHEIVGVVFGEPWAGSAPMVMRLAPAALVQPTCGLLGLFLVSQGQGSKYLRWGLAHAAVTISSIALTVPLGVDVMASSYSLGQLALFIPSAVYCLGGSHVTPGMFLVAHVRPFLHTATALVPACLYSAHVASPETPPAAHLAAAACIFTMVYALLAWRTRAELMKHDR